MNNTRNLPSTPSREWEAMRHDWSLISDVREGLSAIRARGTRYLPKFEAESDADYQGRLSTTVWLPEFNSALDALVARPFSKDIVINSGASDMAKALYFDADCRGNSLNVFARGVFENAIADGWCAILTEYPDMSGAVTRADEQALGARPYFVNIPAQDIIALYTSFRGGREQVDHVRIKESEIIRDGYDEIRIDRIRVLEPGRWETWEARTNASHYSRARHTSTMEMVAQGFIQRGSDTSVPLSFCRLGRMRGNIAVVPPLVDLANLQISLYRALSRKEEAMTYSSSPMLRVIGADKPTEGDIPTGPRSIIYVPSGDGQQSVDYIQPNAANIKEIRDDVRDTIDDMRRLGMQPMTQKVGVSAVGTAVDESKAHSVLQSWANVLKDCLELAYVFAGEYNRDPQPVSLSVHTDFSVGQNGNNGMAELREARRRGDLSRSAWRTEMKRRGELGAQYDAEEDDEALANEGNKAADATSKE